MNRLDMRWAITWKELTVEELASFFPHQPLKNPTQ